MHNVMSSAPHLIHSGVSISVVAAMLLEEHEL